MTTIFEYKGRKVEIRYLPTGLQEIKISGRVALRQLLIDPAETAKQLIDAAENEFILRRLETE